MKWFIAVLGSAAAGVLAFLVFPWLDIAITGVFYDPQRGFWLADAWPTLLIYHGVRYCIWALSLALIGGLIWAYGSAATTARESRRPLMFLLLVLALGPGLIAHSVLKNNWGRPRPEAIAEFGGRSHYVLPGAFSDQCATNCSFVSGHAAAGFYLIAFGWVFPQQRRRWMLAGIIAGCVAGLARIVQGGHFFSDIFFSYWVVWLTASGVWWALARPPLPAGEARNGPPA